ncbi:hypothetical protein ACH4E8_06030 [Streptomyces sp. NPDC017979]|uniref:hypothetical protein n=1 Tax=Streptomyces sp. NPDC017979 TaxID=3365024 RepID=UPI0037A390D6
MSTHTHFPPGTAGRAVVGLLAGGAAGFLLAQTTAAFLDFLFGRDPGEGRFGPALLFGVAPAVFAAVGAFVGSRWRKGGWPS